MTIFAARIIITLFPEDEGRLRQWVHAPLPSGAAPLPPWDSEVHLCIKCVCYGQQALLCPVHSEVLGLGWA